MSTASDERIVDPQEELEPGARDRVEVLEKEEREEEHAHADFEEEVPAQAAGHFEHMMRLLGAVFREEQVQLDDVEGISDHERGAIEVLQEVVRGKDLRSERIVYAEQRLEMLNHVLAVLQPTLAMALTPDLVGLRDQYDALVEEVTDLRDRLEKLDSAQEELFEQDRERFEEAPDTDDDDKPDDDAAAAAAEPDPEKKKGLLDFFRRKKDKPIGGPPTEPADPDAPRPSTLTGKPGEPAVEKKPTRSTLGDD